MAENPFSEGDTVAMQGEISIVHDDGRVTVHFHEYDTPVTMRAEYLSLVAKMKPGRPLRDKW